MIHLQVESKTGRRQSIVGPACSVSDLMCWNLTCCRKENKLLITERLRSGMRILFVGFNPSLTSYERGFNYAGRNNRFYRVLNESGLTTRLYSPSESPRLLEDYGYGFSNIVTRPTRRADELTAEDYAEGRAVLLQKLKQYKPEFACYVGKGVYEQLVQKRSLPWGFQIPSAIPSTRDFVGPSTSGLVRMTLAEQVAIYKVLAQVVLSHANATEGKS